MFNMAERNLVIRFQSDSLQLQQDVQRLARQTDEYRQGLVGLGAAAGAISGAIALAGQGAIATGSKFEQLRIRLKTTLGSESAATDAFSTIEEFALRTPFQVENVTQAFLSLKNRGIEPTIANLTKAGDIASSQGKGLQQFVEAILDSTSGEQERLDFLNL